MRGDPNYKFLNILITKFSASTTPKMATAELIESQFTMSPTKAAGSFNADLDAPYKLHP